MRAVQYGQLGLIGNVTGGVTKLGGGSPFPHNKYTAINLKNIGIVSSIFIKVHLKPLNGISSS